MTFRSETDWRLLRGGSWLSHPRNCRSAYRLRDQPDFASYLVGFRVVCPDSVDGRSIALTNPRWRLLRGGAWSSPPRFCRSAYRYHLLPDGANGHVGFRVVCHAQGDHPIPLEETHD